MVMSGKVAKRFRLKENHSTAIRFAKLCDITNELGLCITFNNNGLVLQDLKHSDLPPILIEDIEDDHARTWISEFPPATEYKLVYDNPIYLEERRKEQEEYSRKLQEEERLEQKKREKQERDEKARERKEIEREERKLLAKLKAKYND